MASKITFSIVIPTLNEENYIGNLLNDLVSQKYTNFEVIVCDGKSDDSTLEIVKSYKDILTIRVVRSNKRAISYQRNKGGKLARGDYILFFDADNRINRYFLRSVMTRLKLTQADAFTSWLRPDKKRFKYHLVATILNLQFSLDYKLGFPTAMGAFIGIRKKYFGSIKFNERRIYSEDKEFMRMAYAKGLKCAIFPYIYYTYSFRRFDKQGIISIMKDHIYYTRISSNPQNNSKINYPMGGGWYNDRK